MNKIGIYLKSIDILTMMISFKYKSSLNLDHLSYVKIRFGLTNIFNLLSKVFIMWNIAYFLDINDGKFLMSVIGILTIKNTISKDTHNKSFVACSFSSMIFVLLSTTIALPILQMSIILCGLLPILNKDLRLRYSILSVISLLLFFFFGELFRPLSIVTFMSACLSIKWVQINVLHQIDNLFLFMEGAVQ